MENSSGPVTILWDYENCPAPKRSGDRSISGTTIVRRLREAFSHLGPIVEIKAFGNASTIPAELREELQTSAVSIVDAISVNKRKDLVDKMIFSHMFCFALDHKPPATVVLIAGDVDYALPLAALGLRKYFIVLVLPPNVKVAQHLQGNAHQVYYWWDVLFPQQPSDQVTAQLRLSASIEKQARLSDATIATTQTAQGSTSSAAVPASDPVAMDSGGLHLRDLCTVLLNLEEAGDSTPLVSKVGLTLKETFPGLFQKGILPELLEAAEMERLVRIEGQKPRHYCVFDPQVLENYIKS
eukprot:TRINITY_DN1587_c0_g1_i1.p1 TRINITY_DN1587_c0_g1~~TRINITY_DN1587_c0_g1_i1.p1  ORF type:complete len:309 (+),score=40.77 TRINITY_DN1587_c0_g1_i1:37-927(+)